ncbi:M14 family zinc carboxypeptidase [candidate division KSB1 bacterium]
MYRNFRKLFLFLVLYSVLALAVFPVTAQQVQTGQEKSGFTEYTSYDGMLEYLQDIQATSTEMLLSSYGTTIEGRTLPYAVFSRPLITQPWEAMASGKPIAVISANVHGGERTLRESVLLLIRELATPGTEANRLLDNIVVVAVPSVNPDGFVRASRGNSQGVDMNRDYMKLEQPALAQYVHNILLTWHPHIFVDGHNGGSYPYNVCYQGPSNAAADQRITLLCDQDILPFMDSKMEASGYKSWYYSGGDSTRWRGGGSDPRIGRNYGGLINSIGILFESPGGQDMEIGAKSGHVGYKSILQYTAQNVEQVLMTANRARRETIEMGQNATGEIAVQMEYAPEDYKVSYEIPLGGRGRGGGGAAGEPRPTAKITGAELIKKPVTTKARPRPYAYILEPRAYKAIAMLKRHKILVEVLQEDTEFEIEAYELTTLERGSEYDHPARVRLTVADETIKRTQTFPKGSYIIRTGQMMGRVVTHLLEPETNDNVITWNTMDAILPRAPSPPREETRQQAQRAGAQRAGARQQAAGRAGQPAGGQRGGRQQQQPVIPIFKLMRPTAIPTKILK